MSSVDPPLPFDTTTPEETIVSRIYQEARNELVQRIIRDPEFRATVRDALTGRFSQAVISAIPWGAFSDELEAARPALSSAMLRAGDDAARGVLSVSMQAFRFDRTDPRALAVARAQSGLMVREVTEKTREAVRVIITEAFAEQITVRDTARRLLQTIGLTPGHARAVANTERSVRERLLAAGQSPAFAERRARTLGQQQAIRLLRWRALTIARTEIQRASGLGRYLGWEQAADQGIMDMGRYGKRWISRVDSCPLCVANTQAGTIPIQSEFVTTGTLMNPGHPNCRCTVVAVPPGYGGWSPPGSPPAAPSLGDLVEYQGTDAASQGPRTFRTLVEDEGGDVELPRDVMDTLDRLNDEWGETVSTIAVADYPGYASTGGTRGNVRIAVNRGTFLSDEFVAKRQQDMGPFVVGTSRRDTIVHEFGHAIERRLPQDRLEAVRREFIPEATRTGGQRTPDLFDIAPSMYALENEAEWSAEMFALGLAEQVPDGTNPAAVEHARRYVERLREELDL